jgi:predicted RNA binding protein YcfA (HicA-like mRNA interferase family)
LLSTYECDGSTTKGVNSNHDKVLPTKNLTHRDVIKILKENGFVEVRQKGSHMTLKDNKGHTAQVPIHNRTIGIGLVQRIWEQAGLTE